jgi:prepilin peptidase CpaA
MEVLLLQRMPATPVIGMLFGLLAWAVVSDVTARRIPNNLVLAGLALAWQAQSLALGWSAGSLAWGAGAVVGMALMLPGYLLRMVGAGDVKLLGTVGAFFGAEDAWRVGLAAMLAGGALALLFIARRMPRGFNPRWSMLCLTQPRLWLESMHVHDRRHAERLPYGVAIAIGCAGVLGLRAS